MMEVIYEGGLRCTARHKSGQSITTDAPVDNHGKGEAFSPTDLLCVSLASCVVTTMGIEAGKLGISFEYARVNVEKFMHSDPRYVDRAAIRIGMPKSLAEHPQRGFLENKGINCPVALSLGDLVSKEITFHYEL